MLKYTVGNNTMRYNKPEIKTIFLDIDGVLSDWVKAALWVNGVDDPDSLMNNWPKGVTDIEGVFPDKHRERLLEQCDHTPHFWEELEKLPWADELVDWAHTYAEEVIILTSPSKYTNCASQKVRWLKNHFPEFANERRFLIGKRKYYCAAPDRLLIDDTPQQTSKFVDYGGRAILFPAQWNTNSGHLIDPIRFVKQEVTKL
jgi:5'(3')-deoxyribonucleotidase